VLADGAPARAATASFPFRSFLPLFHPRAVAFAQYNASEVVMGRTMKDWLRFSVCYWHTFRG
jgi:hypothetical protein